VPEGGKFGRRASHDFARIATAVALSALLLAGCSRLSGDHAAEQEEAQTANMQRLLDDAPESLKAKRATSAFGENEPSSGQTRAEDIGGAIARPDSGAAPANGAFAVVPSARPKTAARPTTPSRSKKKSKAAARKADEIPDAAEIGL
jgi:hypothetical protein